MTATLFRRGRPVAAVAFWVVNGLFAFQATGQSTTATVSISWGIHPTDLAPNNGTRLLLDSGEEWGVDAFNAQYRMRLAYVGDGVCDAESGFSEMRWIGAAEPAEDATVKWSNSPSLTGRFCVPDKVATLPVVWFGDFEDVDPDYEIYDDDDEYYNEVWKAANFATFVQDMRTRRVWRLSESAAGTDFATMSAPTCEITGFPSMLDLNANAFSLIANTPSKAVYLGAEIPQRCVWMADKGLTAADLAGYDEKAVALAMALDKVPAEVAGGVELKIGSFSLDPQAGTATLAFQFTATDESGASAAVSSLRGGARLVLETASSVADFGTENSSKQEVSLSSSSVTIPTSGEAFFARLVLDTP